MNGQFLCLGFVSVKIFKIFLSINIISQTFFAMKIIGALGGWGRGKHIAK